jgi:hypothetical protein
MNDKNFAEMPCLSDRQRSRPSPLTVHIDGALDDVVADGIAVRKVLGDDSSLAVSFVS